MCVWFGGSSRKPLTCGGLSVTPSCLREVDGRALAYVYIKDNRAGVQRRIIPPARGCRFEDERATALLRVWVPTPQFRGSAKLNCAGVSLSQLVRTPRPA
jgi:hypothetical protein